jgi:hypothetical protein
MGKGVDPAATPEQFSEIYQFYVIGTDQIYPIERLPIIRALSGECTRGQQYIPPEVAANTVFI